jgi:hypothetical protein
MLALIITLLAGPVGDYLGYDYQFYIASEGYDSLFTIMGDDGDSMVVDTAATIDTFTYNGHPAYLNHRVRISTINALNDTALCWEIGDTLFGYMIIAGDTLVTKTYVTPFYTGLVWDLQVVGETLIVDIDGDGIDDTLVVQSGEGEVCDSLSLTVPLGTFDVFNVVLAIHIEGWQSIINGQCRLWLWDHQWLSPGFGVVQDSVVIIDSVMMYVWLEAARVCMYSEAVDTGYVAVAEHRQSAIGAQAVLPVVNGILLVGYGDYDIDVYDVSGKMVTQYKVIVNGNRRLKPELPCGVYFARVQGAERADTVKFIVIR